MQVPSIDLIAIVGPTAVGKSAVGLLVAERLGGEIVSADSMQVYRAMDIGTAKPTSEEQARVRHHLIDVVDPEQDYNVARYQSEARAALEEIRARGRLPVLVGGSGLYVRAVLQGLGLPIVKAQPGLRGRLLREASTSGQGPLHQRLAQVDPISAQRIPPTNVRRVVRALEVFETTGVPLSRFHSLAQKELVRYNAATFGLTVNRTALYGRIEERIERMIEAGFVDEVRQLLRRGCHLGLTSMQALGYKQIMACLLGQCPFDEAVRVWKRDTRRFAKRQLTWFRHQCAAEWLRGDDRNPEEIADEIVTRVASSAEERRCRTE